MRSTKVRLLNGTLVGTLSRPKSSRQLIVMCHGYQSSGTNSTFLAVSELLNQKGYATFTFTFSPNTGGTDVEQQVSDLHAIIEHFDSFDEIILLGASFGALSTSITAALDPRVSGLVTISGFMGRRHLGPKYRRTFLVYKTFGMFHPKYRKILRYTKQSLRPENITVPVLVIHSKADVDVLIAQSEWFFSRLSEPKQFIRLDNASHGIRAKADRQLVVDAIDSWMLSTTRQRP